jgi:hypothetical protein
MLTQFSTETLVRVSKVLKKINAPEILEGDDLVTFELFEGFVSNACSALVCESWLEPAALENAQRDLQ